MQLGMIGLGRRDASTVRYLPRDGHACGVHVDGGNSHDRDDMPRGTQLVAPGVRCLDVGTSGGVAGLKRGYCRMIGGEVGVVEHLRPINSSPAPGVEAATQPPGRKAGTGPAAMRYQFGGHAEKPAP